MPLYETQIYPKFRFYMFFLSLRYTAFWDGPCSHSGLLMQKGGNTIQMVESMNPGSGFSLYENHEGR